MSDEPKALPGWYPMPEGGQRYWDGTQWTSHTAPSGPVATKPLSPTKVFGSLLVGFLLLMGIVSGFDSGTTGRDSGDSGVGRVPEAGQNSNSDQEPVTHSGDGEINTDPFDLAAGDYKIRWKTLSDDCIYYAHLRRVGPKESEDMFSANGAGEGSNRLYDVPEGTYYVFVRTGSSPGCGWSVTLSPVS